MIQIDMPMPDNCVECRFNVSEFGYCNAMPVNFCGQVNDFEEDGRPEWCPLKAQEPRVMTLSGVRNLKESTPVWLEDVDKKDVIGALFMRDYNGTKCVDFAIVRDWEFERVTADYMDYGIRWRVWTSRPDQATREATLWE